MTLRLSTTPWPLVAMMTITLIALSPARADDDGGASEGSCKIEATGEVPVAIQSDPSGAILLIRRGGETVARARTPFAGLLAPGRYDLVVNAGRGEPQRRTLEAREGEAVALVVRF